MSLPKIVAHFETQLVNKIDSASATLELAGISTPAGNLPTGTYGFVIDEESSAKREYVIGTLSGSTLTFTKRDVSPLNATTASASGDTSRQSHRKGASIKITNFPILLLIQRLLDGTDQFDASSPFEYDGTASITTANQLATKAYVDSVVNGGTLVLQDQVLLGDAGETVSAGEYLYLKEADGEWYKVDADNIAHLDNTKKGIAQGAGTDGNAIAGGILIEGLDVSITYTTGQLYYASNTAGALATSAGTYSHIVGVGDANGKLVFLGNVKTQPTFNQKIFLNAVTGMIVMYASATPPTGFLLCNGQAVSRTTYADLFAIISTTYGVGDGSTTFNVPDLASRFPLGYSAGAPTKVFTFASRSGNLITITGADNHANNELQTGQAVVYTSSGSVITGLTSTSTYYVIRNAYNQFSLASSVANANAGTAIALSSDGTGTQLFTATYTVRPMAQEGGEETHALTDAQMPSHIHDYVNDGGASSITGITASTGNGGTSTGEITATGGDTPHNIMPLFTVVNYVIKT